MPLSGDRRHRLISEGLSEWQGEMAGTIDLIGAVRTIRAEVDRYIGWPGQALAYKTGQMKISDLRADAEKQLGETFDVRAFHDVVLGSGAVPLGMLEANVRNWIKQTQSQTGG